jgi:DNA-binding IscR family transcriptional regulator
MILDKSIHNNDCVSRGVTRGPGSVTFEDVNFSASTTHALRAMAWLAAHADGDAVLGRDMARRLKIPPDYLSKVLATLARSEVVTPFEGKRARAGCLLRPDRPCRDSGACSAHTTWAGVNEAYREFLEKTTVADIRDAHQPGGRHGTAGDQR